MSCTRCRSMRPSRWSANAASTSTALASSNGTTSRPMVRSRATVDNLCPAFGRRASWSASPGRRGSPSARVTPRPRARPPSRGAWTSAPAPANVGASAFSPTGLPSPDSLESPAARAAAGESVATLAGRLGERCGRDPAIACADNPRTLGSARNGGNGAPLGSAIPHFARASPNRTIAISTEPAAEPSGSVRESSTTDIEPQYRFRNLERASATAGEWRSVAVARVAAADAPSK